MSLAEASVATYESDASYTRAGEVRNLSTTPNKRKKAGSFLRSLVRALGSGFLLEATSGTIGIKR
jgi:hypothetical protein